MAERWKCPDCIAADDRRKSSSARSSHASGTAHTAHHSTHSFHVRFSFSPRERRERREPSHTTMFLLHCVSPFLVLNSACSPNAYVYSHTHRALLVLIICLVARAWQLAASDFVGRAEMCTEMSPVERL